jgi:hypothetical protein
MTENKQLLESPDQINLSNRHPLLYTRSKSTATDEATISSLESIKRRIEEQNPYHLCCDLSPENILDRIRSFCLYLKIQCGLTLIDFSSDLNCADKSSAERFLENTLQDHIALCYETAHEFGKKIGRIPPKEPNVTSFAEYRDSLRILELWAEGIVDPLVLSKETDSDETIPPHKKNAAIENELNNHTADLGDVEPGSILWFTLSEFSVRGDVVKFKINSAPGVAIFPNVGPVESVVKPSYVRRVFDVDEKTILCFFQQSLALVERTGSASNFMDSRDGICKSGASSRSRTEMETDSIEDLPKSRRKKRRRKIQGFKNQALNLNQSPKINAKAHYNSQRAKTVEKQPSWPFQRRPPMRKNIDSRLPNDIGNAFHVCMTAALLSCNLVTAGQQGLRNEKLFHDHILWLRSLGERINAVETVLDDLICVADPDKLFEAKCAHQAALNLRFLVLESVKIPEKDEWKVNPITGRLIGGPKHRHRSFSTWQSVVGSRTWQDGYEISKACVIEAQRAMIARNSGGTRTVQEASSGGAANPSIPIQNQLIVEPKVEQKEGSGNEKRDPHKPGAERIKDIMTVIKLAGVPLQADEIVERLGWSSPGKIKHNLSWMVKNGLLIKTDNGYWPSSIPVPN